MLLPIPARERAIHAVGPKDRQTGMSPIRRPAQREATLSFQAFLGFDAVRRVPDSSGERRTSQVLSLLPDARPRPGTISMFRTN